MALSDVLQGDFFNEYIKIGRRISPCLDYGCPPKFGADWEEHVAVLTLRTGNIIMISKGRRDVDNVFTIKDGASVYALSPSLRG